MKENNYLPSVKLQTTFLQLLNPSVIILALLLSDSRIPLLYVSTYINTIIHHSKGPLNNFMVDINIPEKTSYSNFFFQLESGLMKITAISMTKNIFVVYCSSKLLLENHNGHARFFTRLKIILAGIPLPNIMLI